MGLRGDRPGQPVRIGFILPFGILVLAFAGYRSLVVPEQNAEIEFDHFRTVEISLRLEALGLLRL